MTGSARRPMAGAPLAARELAAVRWSVVSGRPYGEGCWWSRRQPAPLPDGLAANATPLAASPEEIKLTDATDPTPNAETAEATQNAAVWETAVRLPFPFNIMKPEDIPEEVWHRARMAQEKNW